jgi:hypothetical protein
MLKNYCKKYGYKMIYDIDDFIYKGPDEGEEIPAYNFGGYTIGDDFSLRRKGGEAKNKPEVNKNPMIYIYI